MIEVDKYISIMSKLYRTIPGAKSLYIRGSASKEKVDHQPWDIDFVVVVSKSNTQIDYVFNFIADANLRLGHPPYLDVRLVHDEDPLNIKYIHTLLLLKDSSKLVLGDKLDFSSLDTISIEERNKIFNLYSSKFEDRFDDYFNSDLNFDVKVEKSKRLVKSLLRIGALLKFKNGGRFDRNPLSGYNLLTNSKHFSLEETIIIDKYMEGSIVSDSKQIIKIYDFFCKCASK